MLTVQTGDNIQMYDTECWPLELSSDFGGFVNPMRKLTIHSTFTPNSRKFFSHRFQHANTGTIAINNLHH